MRIDWWTLGLQTINLLVLFWLLGRFLFRPMADMVARRQAEVGRRFDEAQAARDKAERAAQAAQEEQERTLAARDAVLDAAHRDAEGQRATLIEAARKDAAALQAGADVAIAHERAEMQARLEGDAGALATEVAARLLEQPAGQLPVDAFLGQLGQALAALPEKTRQSIGDQGAPVSLASARALDAAARATIAATVEQALGRPVDLAFSVDPALIAGLRLGTDMAQIDANLRTDLDRVRTELTRRDA